MLRCRVVAYGSVESSHLNSPHSVVSGRAVPFCRRHVNGVPLFSDTSGVELLPGRCLSDIEYADDIALLGSDPTKMQVTLNNINKPATKFVMHLAPSKCKVLLQDWSGPNPNLVLADQSIEMVDKFIYLGSRKETGP